ncbi:SoxY-related AACIE arm protein [Henriciella aquimarina]|uniref:SoxY-related AACIE arm protein n=1 Tax=Henriciella aquimarina TaxID=545261 RepID=UPI000A0311A6|nr:SoxY-related AACIE arm protein [Henriciella aquimarina]
MTRPPHAFPLTRRSILLTGTAGLVSAALPFGASATPEDADAAIRALFGDRLINDGKVTVKLPPIAENGNSVAIGVSVDSPMSEDDYVKQIALFSPRNPIADVARFHLGPRAGKAEVSTRIRMAGTQTVRAIAEMNDGSLWKGTASTVVTLAACVIG